METWIINLAYLISSICFIMGLKMLSSPKTARSGNLIGAFGMLLAVVITLKDQQVVGFEGIAIGLIIGSIIGAVFALRVPMTAMPEMVALLNGFGGAASTFVAGSAYIATSPSLAANPQSMQWIVALFLSLFIGAVTFTGSLVAYGKLQGLLGDAAAAFTGQKPLMVLLLLGSLYGGYELVTSQAGSGPELIATLVAASILGVFLVNGIGGADMPVVIALLNSYSGLAAAMTGFVLSNNMLIICGSLVGASGLILTKIMCKAMNRSLANVLFGGEMGGPTISRDKNNEFYEGKVKSADPEEIAMILENAQSVVFVPGYGLAVAQAQHTTRELADILEARGCEVRHAIHPVAGRMPGHMNVLLAEAEVPYEQLIEMDSINPEFRNTDVSIILGANDVVNPAALDDSESPIYGMPILEVHNSKTVVVVKRSLSPGFAGIPNPLFVNDNSLMCFGDAKKVLQGMIHAIKEL